MDVKSAFLYGKIEEEVYVCQPLGFEDLDFPNKVYKVEKALYGLHQAPRAWYENLSTYLLDNGFQIGQIDKTLFIKSVKSDILLVQIYVDDIIFGSTKKELCTEFEKLMHKNQDKYVDEILKKFVFLTVKTTSTPMETSKPLMKDENAKDVDVHLYRSMIDSLIYLTSSRPDIMFALCARARIQVTPKVSHLHAMKRIFKYLKGQPKLGLWYPKDSPFDLEAYSDSDYAIVSLDRKSTTGGCQFLGSRLISWQCKKKTIVANSTTEAEYVVAAMCQAQTNVDAEENNDNQAEFTNPFCTPVQEIAESSSRNIGTSNIHTFNQPQDSEYRWTKDHPLTQVRGNPSKPVQTRRQLATDPEMCMFALTVSTAEPKNIKEAMADSAWIEAMQEELY
ncbi:putative ribonuclease H-like domain-containing protein [Tanacetum coccineum]